MYEEFHKNAKFWLEFTLSCFALTLFILGLNIIWKWRNSASLIKNLPMWKLKFYHVLGHLQINLYTRRIKYPVSHHACDFEHLNAYSMSFKDYSFASAWASFFHVIIVHRADSVETILSNSTELQKSFLYKFTHPWLGSGLLTSHSSDWKNRRKLLTPAFHFNILKDFVVVFNKQAKILTDVLSKHTSEDFIDISPFITKCSFDIICESILGVDIKAQTSPSCPYLTSVHLMTGAIFERMINPLLWPDFIFRRTALGKKFFENVKLVHELTYQIIAEKKKKRLLAKSADTVSENADEFATRQKRALLDLMLDEHLKNNSLSEKDMREEVDTFTFEGHDTTSVSICWALYLIGLHPDIQEKIHQELDSIFGDSDRDVTMDDLKEMKYLECVVKESLRLFPSVPLFGRHLNQDVEFQGMLVPKGTTCLIFSYFLHRDANVFPNPEKFDPERFFPENSVGRHPFAYIPFAAGPRNCIGQRFALMEEKTVISTLLRKFSLRSLDPRDKIHVKNEVVLRPEEKLRIEIRLRSHIPETPPQFFYFP